MKPPVIARSPRRLTTRRGVRGLAVAVALLVASTATSCSWTGLATVSCTSDARPQVRVPTDHGVPYPSQQTYADGTTFDATGRTFNTGRTSQYAMKIHKDKTGDGTCVVGGTFTTEYHPEDTPWDTWHDSTSVIVVEPDVHLVDQRFYNVGDAVQFALNASDWRVTGMRVEALDAGQAGGYVHDDCIENDGMNAGVIRDSKFDGCWVFISARASDPSRQGGDNVVEVRDSLVRMQPYRNAYNTPVRGENTWGDIFKWSERTDDPTKAQPPRLLLDNVIFRVDTVAIPKDPRVRGLADLPLGSTCRNVTLVTEGGWGSDPANPTSPAWLASDLATWKSQCTNLRFADESVWDAAVAQWDALHPLG